MATTALDRQRIVAVALDLLDEVGLDKLSTRALATRLNVQSPALYWHFKSKSELIAAMAEAMSLQLAVDDGASLGSRPRKRAVAAWLVARAQAFRRSLLSRRDGARVHAGSRPPESRFGVVETQLDVLVRAGLEPIDAARTILSISRFVVGWVLEEQAEADERSAPDLAPFPRLSELAATFAGGGNDDDFDACLDAVVTGLLRVR